MVHYKNKDRFPHSTTEIHAPLANRSSLYPKHRELNFSVEWPMEDDQVALEASTDTDDVSHTLGVIRKKLERVYKRAALEMADDDGMAIDLPGGLGAKADRLFEDLERNVYAKNALPHQEIKERIEENRTLLRDAVMKFRAQPEFEDYKAAAYNTRASIERN